MKKIFTLLFLTGILCLGAMAQDDASQDGPQMQASGSTELYPAFMNGRPTPFNSLSCIDLISFTRACENRHALIFGVVIVNNDPDWFLMRSGRGDRSKVVRLGQYNWNDKFKVPVVHPWPEDGKFPTQGPASVGVVKSDASDGMPWGDNSPIVPSGINDRVTMRASNKKFLEARGKKKEIYAPYSRAIEGEMYVAHVVDDSTDQYFLFRVDKLESGVRVNISWKKIDAPGKK